jgi:hypothetical protein
MSGTLYTYKATCKLSIINGLTYKKEYTIDSFTGSFFDDTGNLRNIRNLWQAMDTQKGEN